MFEKEKCIIVTNNDRVADKYKDLMKIELLDSYEDVLVKARDLVYDRHRLLTHPQAGSLKPNQTPYRSIIVYPADNNSNLDDVMMIEKAIETFNKFKEIKDLPDIKKRQIINNHLKNLKTNSIKR